MRARMFTPALLLLVAALLAMIAGGDGWGPW